MGDVPRPILNLCAKIPYSCLLHQMLMTSILPQNDSSILLSIGTINTTIAKHITRLRVHSRPSTY